jgi:hypothetical protein
MGKKPHPPCDREGAGGMVSGAGLRAAVPSVPEGMDLDSARGSPTTEPFAVAHFQQELN